MSVVYLEIPFSDATNQALRAKAQEQGITVNDLVNLAVQQHLEKDMTCKSNIH